MIGAERANFSAQYTTVIASFTKRAPFLCREFTLDAESARSIVLDTCGFNISVAAASNRIAANGNVSIDCAYATGKLCS